jgi:hypothetical protein
MLELPQFPDEGLQTVIKDLCGDSTAMHNSIVMAIM